MTEPPADPIEYAARWVVRNYELDSNGHVNNAVYLNWAEEIASRHAEAPQGALVAPLSRPD
jgi:acyl-ACP thioesterase